MCTRGISCTIICIKKYRLFGMYRGRKYEIYSSDTCASDAFCSDACPSDICINKTLLLERNCREKSWVTESASIVCRDVGMY